ncbi:hypothetical protein J3Q64DRAFT_1731695 [Phycomyces blakesleeanus]|uniref:Centrosomin N-terminal motif 1 domain-containing protein n=1 Tax=Phycomyces blakesleeanus TaxID=4837 RepID=A0ABR3B5U6_PHYBL
MLQNHSSQRVPGMNDNSFQSDSFINRSELTDDRPSQSSITDLDNISPPFHPSLSQLPLESSKNNYNNYNNYNSYNTNNGIQERDKLKNRAKVKDKDKERELEEKDERFEVENIEQGFEERFETGEEEEEEEEEEENINHQKEKALPSSSKHVGLYDLAPDHLSLFDQESKLDLQFEMVSLADSDADYQREDRRIRNGRPSPEVHKERDNSSKFAMKEQAKALEKLHKENFNFKLKIYHLENRLENMSPEQVEQGLKEVK